MSDDTPAVDTPEADEGLAGIDFSDVIEKNIANEPGSQEPDSTEDTKENETAETTQEAAEEEGETEDTAEEQDEEAKKEPEADDVPDKTWDNVLRLEKASRELKAENKELKTQLEELEGLKGKLGELTEVQEFIEKFNDDPIGYLDEMLGVEGFMAWGERLQRGGEPGQAEEMQKMRRKLERLEKATKEDKDTAVTKERETAKIQYLDAIAEYAQANDMVEAFQEYNGVAIAWDLTNLHYEETNEILLPEQAARLAYQAIKADMEKNKPAQEEEEQKEKTKAPAKTLTSKADTTSRKTGKGPNQHLDLSETETLSKAAALVSFPDD